MGKLKLQEQYECNED